MNITYLTADDREKLKLVERVFNSLDKEEIQELLGHDLVVGRLKGIPERSGFLTSIVSDNEAHDHKLSSLQTEVMALRTEIVTLRSDLTLALRYMNDKFNSYNADFNNLKNRYGIY